MEAEQTTESTNDAAQDWQSVANASEQADIEARTTTCLRLVSVPLTTEQRALANDLQAQTWRDIKAAKATRSLEAADWREKITKLEKDMDRFAEEAETGIGSVEIECRKVPCDANNAWQFFRIDTGELVAEEPMTASDKQQDLPFDANDGVDEEEAGENDIDDPAAVLAAAKEDDAPKANGKRRSKKS